MEEAQTPEPTLGSVQAEVESLKRSLESAESRASRWVGLSAQDASRKERVKDYITENYGDWDSEAQEVATQIAEYLDIELSRQVDLTLTITASLSVNVPLGTDPDNLDSSDFDIDISDSYHTEISIDSVDIESVEVEVD